MIPTLIWEVTMNETTMDYLLFPPWTQTLRMERMAELTATVGTMGTTGMTEMIVLCSLDHSKAILTMIPEAMMEKMTMDLS